MKRTIYLKLLTLAVAAVTVFAFGGCNKNTAPNEESSVVSEESSEPEVTNPLEGQWQSENMSEYVYTFNGDGTGEYDMAGNVLPLNYETEGGKITITFLEEGYTPVTLEYEIDGNRLNIKDSFGSDTFYVRVEN